jgi:hypothetical protein
MLWKSISNHLDHLGYQRSLKRKREELLGSNKSDEYHWHRDGDLVDVPPDLEKKIFSGYKPSWKSSPRLLNKVWSDAPSVWLGDNVVLVWGTDIPIPYSSKLRFLKRDWYVKKYRVDQFVEYEITDNDSIEISLREITTDADLTRKLKEGDNVYFPETIKNDVTILKSYKYWGIDPAPDIDGDPSVLLSREINPRIQKFPIQKFPMKLNVFKQGMTKKLIILKRLSKTYMKVNKDTIKLSESIFYYHLVECRGITLKDCPDIIKKNINKKYHQSLHKTLSRIED